MTSRNARPRCGPSRFCAGRGALRVSRYGTLSTWAEELGYEEAGELLDATLQEEKNTDKTLTGIAKSVVNIEAEQDEAEEE
jgi:ferritin-like metal-binding protein YciE